MKVYSVTLHTISIVVFTLLLSACPPGAKEPTGSPPLPPKAAVSPDKIPEQAPAQNGVLPEGPAQKTFTAAADAYFSSHPKKRIYIQLDKPLYQPGETIWLRTLAVNSATFTEKGSTGVSYQLVSPRGSVVLKKRVRQNAGIAFNDFELPLGIKGGEYTIRVQTEGGAQDERPVIVSVYQAPRFKKKMDFVRKAYGAGDLVAATVEIRRATEEAFANRELTGILTLDGVELPRVKASTDDKGAAVVEVQLPGQIERGDAILTVLVDDAGITESVTKRVPIVVNKMQLSFFPEGGDLVAGLPSRVYFYAQDMIDKPADIEGKVVDDHGQTITTLRSYHDGMGRFALTPATGRRYHVEISKPVGVVEKYALPMPQPQGCTLRTYDDPKGEQKSLQVAVHCSQKRTVLLNAMLREQRLGSATAEVEPGNPAVVHLPLSRTNMQGVVRVTLLSDGHEPLAERLTYRGWHRDLKVKVTATQKDYTPRGKVTLQIETKDLAGEPVSAALAMAVVDDTVLSYADDKTAHLLTHLYLEREVPGKIEEPNFYFDREKPKAPLALEMLLGTRGWRKFQWQQVIPATDATVANSNTAETATAMVADQAEETEFHRDKKAAKPQATPRMVKTKGITKPIMQQAAKNRVGERAARRKDLAGRQGLLALLGTKGGGEVAGVFGEGGLGAGEIGGLEGVGVGFGDDGFGGGGIGAGRAGVAKGPARVRGRVVQGTPQVMGSLDKNIIRRVMRQQTRSFKFCYERELSRDPNLRGRVGTEFVIGANGRVLSANITSDTLNNKAVGNCLKRQLKRMRFPTPSGGGVVKVHYPLVFQAPQGEAVADRQLLPRRPPAPVWAKVRVFPAPTYSDNYDGPRTDFRETIYWNPEVKTDAMGKAEVSFYLSDAVTSFRVTTEGLATTGLAGRNEMVLKSKLPFFMDAKIPLEVSAGDHIDLPLTMRNEQKQPLAVSLASTFGDRLKLLEKVSPGALQLAPNSGRTLTFPLDVVGHRGKTEIVFGAQAQGLRDEFKQSINIVPLGYSRTVSQSGSLAKTTTHKLELKGALDNTILASATFYPSPLASMLKGIESIMREPRGCFEQASSSNYPNIMVLQYLQQRRLAEPKIQARAKDLLAKGYLKTVGFESADKGFEWFGGNPGHEALTAYGLLQYVDMGRVFGGVDSEMIRRTRGWLYGRRDGSGGFKRNARALDSFGRASKPVTDAYIVYALTEAGMTGIDTELAAVTEVAHKSSDPYIVALATRSQLNANSNGQVGASLAAKLAKMQRKDGGFRGTSHSVTRSGGHSLDVETTSLALLALLGTKSYNAESQRAAKWLVRSRRGRGGFGSTQATILALKALTAYHKVATKNLSGGEIALRVNGQVVDTLKYGKSQRRPISLNIDGLKPGVNDVELTLTAKKAMPYSLSVDYRTNDPASSPQVPLTLKTDIVANTVKMGETVRVTTALHNTSDQGLPMTLIRLGIPGGLHYQTWQLKELVEKKQIAFYETRAREVIFYFRDLGPNAKKEIAVDLVARVPGTYTAPASSAYLYYTAEHKAWASPLKIRIDRKPSQ